MAGIVRRDRTRGLSRSAVCPAPDANARDLAMVRRLFRTFQLSPGSSRRRWAAVPNIVQYLKPRNSRVECLSALRRIRGSADMGRSV